MKTFVKIFLLILFIFTAIGGVFIFVKTQIAPPSAVGSEDQFSNMLSQQTDSFGCYQSFPQLRNDYLALDDKIKRCRKENFIGNSEADTYSMNINTKYGEALSRYGFGLFSASAWNNNTLHEMLGWLDKLGAERLSDGSDAFTDTFRADAQKLHDIFDNYQAASYLSNNTGFAGLGDAREKIAKAKTFASDPYLSNNIALVSALDEVPAKIARSHYYSVKSDIDRTIGNYTYYESDIYYSTVVPGVKSKLNEYKSTGIYGSYKPSAAALDAIASDYMTQAGEYYRYQAGKNQGYR